MDTKQKVEKVGRQIIEAFKTPEALPAVLAPMFLKVKGNIPCRSWSWSNQFIAAINGTTDARGFKQWKGVNRKVTKGSKAFYILGPCTKKIDDPETGEPKTIIYGFKAIPVFRVQDTEGEDLETADPEIDAWLDSLPLIDVARDWGLDVTVFSGRSGSHLGSYRHGKAITVGVSNLSTWLHELVHAADDRLGTISKRPGQQLDNETVAEFGGAILAELLGFPQDADLGGCYSYLTSYAKAEGKDTVNVCCEFLDRTCKAVSLILETQPEAQEVAA